MLNIPSRKQIADALDVTPETATKFLKSIGITNRILNWKDLETLREACHPLFFEMSRVRLAKVYKRHAETLARDLREIGITHGRKLSMEELHNVYWKLRVPDWINPLEIDKRAPTRANVERFYSGIGVTMPEKWYVFYFITLGMAEISQNPASFDNTQLQYVWSPPR